MNVSRPYFLSLGSNIDPDKNVPFCLKVLRETFKVIRVSSVYETPPFGPAGPYHFWNAAALIETELSPDELRIKLSAIETKLGRTRTHEDKFAPRTMDLDLIPKPGYQQQAFVMVPLAEIAPETRDRETGKSFKELAEALTDQSRSFRKMPAGS